MTLDRRTFVMSASAALTASGCAPPTRNVLYLADTHASDYPTVRATAYMSKILAEKTNNRLSIKPFVGGQLGSERDTLEITMFGGLDLNRVNLAPLNPIAAETLVPSLPFVFRSIAHMRAAMDGAPGRKILDALRPFGLVGLCFYDSGARSFYNSKHPIETPDDLKGLKIRVQNSDLYVAMVEALGANATPMSFSEVYQGLVQGVIDGAENNWPSYDTTRHFEAAPFYSTSEHVMAPEVLVISKRRWDKLSEDDRQAVQDAANASVPYMRTLWDERVATAKARVLAGGAQLTEITDKTPFQDLMAPVYDRFLTSDLRELLEEISDVQAKDV